MTELASVDSREFGERLVAGRPGKRFPLIGQWEVTCRCNLRCVMCYTDCFNTPEHLQRELELAEIVRIMDEVAEAGCLELCLTGGEPLARRDFLGIYDHAKRSGFLLTVFTNATLITPRIADHWVQLPPSMIEVSLHGLSETFERVTAARGSWARCLGGIRLLLERRLPVTLKTTGMTINREEIATAKRFAEDLAGSYGVPIGYKFGSEMRPRLDGSEDVLGYQLADPDVATIEAGDPDLRAERARQDHAVVEARRRGDARCDGAHSRFHIDAYGQLQLCSMNRRHGYDLRHGSFREGFYEFLPRFPCPTASPFLGAEAER